MTEFITRNNGNKNFEIIIKTDSKEHYKATEEFVRRLIDYAKPQANADRIRAMSDEELAKFLADEISHGDCCDCDLECATFEGDKFENSCHNAFYRWLQQPAEE